MNSKQMLVTIALVSIGIASQSASATTIDVTYMGSANFGKGGVGYGTGSIAPNPDLTSTLVNVGIGGDSFTSENVSFDFSATGQFNTWCVDIFHWISGGTTTYNVGTGSDLATALNLLRTSGTLRVTQLGILANEFYSTVDTLTESAAFQLAVWAITYGSADPSGHFSVGTSDPNFKVDGTTVISAYGLLANSWLRSLGTTANTGNYTLVYLNDGTRNGTQDMIVFTDPPLNVPEPATLALLGLGLAGLGFSRGKKTQLDQRRQYLVSARYSFLS